MILASENSLELRSMLAGYRRHLLGAVSGYALGDPVALTDDVHDLTLVEGAFYGTYSHREQ